MFLGYNTNGFAHHRLEHAVEILSRRCDYAGVALTLDVHHLDPFAPDPENQIAKARKCIDGNGLHCVVETGARFLLNPEVKHQPTLLTTDQYDRTRRAEFLTRSVDIAAQLDADCVSFWSGTPTDDTPQSELMSRLVDGCKRLADHAADQGVRLAFEPEPGMFIDTMDKFAELHARVHHPAFGLTVDVGHLVCNGELPVSKHLVAWKHVLWNVHVEDMRRGVHDHLMFGEGEVDFADVFAGLKAAGYANGVYVELSRHSHDAVNTARTAKAFLDRFMRP
ncbi:MAG: sugar phosphate isomerase/epimerase [Gemmataceae bacterium]|nr:sugar phosphate isomerase/epimerase [Gemmataceae bacterium]